ncbi:MAG TPA: MarR family transcriptional regulator [Streptosporangiaceae bacterium]|jgi:DNA-binding MarR family transcriptional regulator|nr:MarR family transcriptional regulator [Streptosporangiaceae bacterium]
MDEKLDPDDVAAALYLSIGLFRRRLRQAPLPGELTLPEMSALSRLERAGSATPGELAKEEQISPQAMGTTLGSLEERGFIQRRSDPADGRRVVMSLTEAGQQVIHNKRSARHRLMAKALANGFTQPEIETLMAAAPLIQRLGESI